MGSGFVFYVRESDIQQPSAQMVILDEDERSINDGFFVTDPDAGVWWDFPANSAYRHNYSFVLNFADGHCEIWPLSDPHTQQVAANHTEASGNTDLARLANAASRPAR